MTPVLSVRVMLSVFIVFISMSTPKLKEDEYLRQDQIAAPAGRRESRH